MDAAKKPESGPTPVPDDTGEKPAKLEDHIVPMLAKLHEGAFNDTNWIFEIKWDGYRAIADISKQNRLLYSRNGLSFEEQYPIISKELDNIKAEVVLDGEIVALDDKGVPRFQLLQQYMKEPDTQLVYYVFDCLSVNGKSIEDKPLTERKQILKDLLPESDIIRYCDHIEEKGKDFFRVMQQQGLEGMIAKRANSIYTEGARSDDWLKVKNVIIEEAVIAGYTEPRGGRKYFGSLILGVYAHDELNFIGHTGTGFTHKSLQYLHEKLEKIKITRSPFATKVPVNAPVTWVKPELVCNIKYSEITDDKIRRHPVFLGLRIDKEANEVHSEVRDTDTIKETGIRKTLKDKNMQLDITDGVHTIDKKPVTFSHVDKVFWPDEGYTKGDVIAYYNTVYKYILPYIKDRPQSLLRMPNGIAEKGFFHKDAGVNAPDWIKKYPVWSESADKEIDYIVCNDLATLLYMNNLGSIEINPWNSRIGSIDNPDFLVIDLDPSDKNTFDDVIETAQAVKQVLDKAGATSFPKTSGSSGIHVYVPLGAKYTYDQGKDFAHMIATLVHDQLPDITTLERSLSKRAKDQLYIDFLQNRKGQTLACAYSLRPKPGATVSTPLEWGEVKKGLHPSNFTFKNIMQRIEKKGDLFAGVLKKGIDMGKCIDKLSE